MGVAEVGAAGSRKLGGRAVEGPAEEFVLYLLKEEKKIES